MCASSVPAVSVCLCTRTLVSGDTSSPTLTRASIPSGRAAGPRFPVGSQERPDQRRDWPVQCPRVPRPVAELPTALGSAAFSSFLDLYLVFQAQIRGPALSIQPPPRALRPISSLPVLRVTIRALSVTQLRPVLRPRAVGLETAGGRFLLSA